MVYVEHKVKGFRKELKTLAHKRDMAKSRICNLKKSLEHQYKLYDYFSEMILELERKVQDNDITRKDSVIELEKSLQL